MQRLTCDVRGEVALLAGGTQGPPVVLVHGLDVAAAGWLDVLPTLAAEHRVLAVDLPGFGRSPLGRRRTSLGAHAAVVGEVVREQIGRPAVLVGSSAGAVVTLLAAARHPQVAAGVVLLAPTLPRRTDAAVDLALAPLLVPSLLPGMLMLEPWRRSLLAPEAQVQELLDHGYADNSERASPATFAALVEDARQRRRRDHLRAWDGGARSLLGWLSRPARFHAMAEEVRAPVTLVEGVEDPLMSRAVVREASQRHPDWEHVALAGVGHLPHLERPAAVVDTLRLAARE